ncbi:hypothetical protein MLD38_005723 [Melastoma candidum]|uniref:Uncharacterized protein n=1 Tax=Melastoma candidum TaxID=119954 RepID=A0ACB9RMJ6_9MYRT|nr:hypothetical protein MLD38_005723 [Melastoma candidum]
MSLCCLMFRSLVRLVAALVGDPVTSLTTILHYSELLPANVGLARMVRREMLDQQSYLFHLIISLLGCFL